MKMTLREHFCGFLRLLATPPRAVHVDIVATNLELLRQVRASAQFLNRAVGHLHEVPVQNGHAAAHRQ
ncbi:MAG: hypothetical protein AAF564_21715, partial [Bacteroidota bacterium]